MLELKDRFWAAPPAESVSAPEPVKLVPIPVMLPALVMPPELLLRPPVQLSPPADTVRAPVIVPPLELRNEPAGLRACHLEVVLFQPR